MTDQTLPTDSQNTETPVPQGQQFEFRAEIQQLLNILIHSLYTDREIFLREAISNASDALNRMQFEMLTNPNVLDPGAELAIRVTVDADAKTITISDTGIGLTREELIENLGTIAHSGAKSFIDALKAKGDGTKATDIIGQFGVGFYALFMVADEVQVTTRSYHPDGQAWIWKSRGDSAYTIAEGDKTTRGTDVQLTLKEDATEFLNEARLSTIIRTHSNYIPFPIRVGTNEEPVNQQTAIWRRPAREVSEDEYTAFYQQLTYDMNPPLLHIQQAVDTPMQFYSLLFIPSTAERGLFNRDDQAEFGPRLYARKVLIQEHAVDLLPQWLRFVEGVVDSEDLPLNISRETVQANAVMTQLKGVIVRKILSELESMADHEPEKYATFWAAFSRLIKEGLATDITYRDRLVKLLRVHSSRDQTGWLSLAEYKARMIEGQNEIYYLVGDNMQSITHSPHMDVFRTRGIEVIYLTEPIDSFILSAIPTFDGTPLRSISEGDLNLPTAPEDEAKSAETPELGDSEWEALRAQFTSTLGDRVSDIHESKVLTDSPARLVAQRGYGPDMERVYKMLNQEYSAPKRALEINRRHPLIAGLSTLNGDSDSAIRSAIIEQIYESALLLEGIHPNPADMVPRIQALMEAATRRSGSAS